MRNQEELAAQKPGRESHVYSQLRIQEDRIGLLFNKIHSLQDRLSTVLRGQEIPEVKPETVPEYLVPLADTVRSNNNQLEKAIAEISLILDHLEL